MTLALLSARLDALRQQMADVDNLMCQLQVKKHVLDGAMQEVENWIRHMQTTEVNARESSSELR